MICWEHEFSGQTVPWRGTIGGGKLSLTTHLYRLGKRNMLTGKEGCLPPRSSRRTRQSDCPKRRWKVWPAHCCRRCEPTLPASKDKPPCSSGVKNGSSRVENSRRAGKGIPSQPVLFCIDSAEKVVQIGDSFQWFPVVLC